MRIIVCIKQVPGTSQVEIDQKTGTLKRDGVESKLNPYDLFALESAMRFKERYGGMVSVITMGPPQCEAAVREAFMMGADEGYILSDRRFGGADVLATSYTLAEGIRSIGGFDAVICGKQTTDGDTAQVGAELAEFLGIPHVTNVCKIYSADNDKLVVDMDMPAHFENSEVRFPCLITVEKGIYEPRLPSYKLKVATAERPVHWIKLDNLPDRDAEHYGLNGSPTQVKRIFPPENHQEHVMLSGSAVEQGDQIFDVLNGKKFLQKL